MLPFDSVAALVANQLRMTLRIPIAALFTFLIPVMLFFTYTIVFGHGDPQMSAHLMPAVVVFTLITNGIYSAGAQLVSMRERGSLQAFRMTPLRSWHLLLGRLIGNYVILCLTIGAQFLLAALLYGVRPPNPAAMSVVVTIGALEIPAIGLFISSIVNSAEEATVVNQSCFLILIFLSGVTFPIGSLPVVLQMASQFLPTAHLVSIIDLIMTGRSLALVNMLQLTSMVVTTACIIFTAVICFRWDKHSKLNRRTRVMACAAFVPALAIGILANVTA